MVDMNYDARILRMMKESGALAGQSFRLFDVGASQGLEGSWRQFGELLRADGFDPLETEMDRLNGLSEPNIRYHAAWITAEDPLVREGIAESEKSFRTGFAMTSAQRALDVMRVDYRQEVFNKGAELKYTDRRISIDRFCSENGVARVDFLKVDTDGHDIGVLLGSRETFATRGLLGAMIECQFHGPSHPQSNTFANIDILMRANGYNLFLLDAWRYTRYALPGTFVYDIQAQTRTGQVQWGDAVYFLDPVSRPELFDTLGPAEIAKLIALLDLFALPDCVATLVAEMQKRDIKIPGLDLEGVLDLCVPANPYGLTNHRDYVAYFDRNPSAFFGSKWDAASLPDSAAPTEQRQPEASETQANPLSPDRAEVGRDAPTPGWLRRLFGG